METQDCVFCNVPKEKCVTQNRHGLAILAKNPIVTGHTLLIPIKHCKTIEDIDLESLIDLMRLAKKVTADLKKNLKCDGVNILHASGSAAQQSVEHFHIHVVPRYEKDGLDLWFLGKTRI